MSDLLPSDPNQLYRIVKIDLSKPYSMNNAWMVDWEEEIAVEQVEPDAGILLCLGCKSEAAGFCIANEGKYGHILKPALAFVIEDNDEA